MVENHFENNIIRCKKPATLLLHFRTRAYLFSPDEESCYIFLTRNNCCEFLASYDVIFKVIFNYTSKCQFMVLLFRKSIVMLNGLLDT